MTDKTEIQNQIKNFSGNGTVDAAVDLLSVLGYDTSRRVNIPIDKEKLCSEEVKSVTLFMQLTDAEMSGAESRFETGRFEDKNIESYLFIAVDLVKPEYNRSTLATITRSINKLFAIPVFVVFRYGDYVTPSMIYRRIHKRDEQKDVLEKVTLIKDINVNEPHRGHIDILYDLALPRLREQYPPVTNFVELDEAWRKVLDTKLLNKRFYTELSHWYYWAMDKVRFPEDKEKDREIRNATNLIRLVTRIVFIWFIKEKGLVPENLFDSRQLKTLLKNFHQDETSHDYYNAILQNLFFGTLNQKMEERNFIPEWQYQGKNSHFNVTTFYRT